MTPIPSDLYLFPFGDYLWFYAAFIVFVLAVLALDLGVFHRKAHAVGFKEATGWSIFWISLGLLFGWGFSTYAEWKLPQDPRLAGYAPEVLSAWAKQAGQEYFTGFLVEKSLSVDNIFIFAVVFTFFAIPAQYQHRVLFYGILGALFFRVIFIAAGSYLMKFHWIVLAMGVFLVLTGLKVMFAPDKPINPEKNPIIKLMKKFIPVHPKLEGEKFLIRKDGILYATPLMICLVFIELTDIVFAVDSVPAIFAITKEPLIVFTSNIFAILGLRALYFLLAGAKDKFRFLKYGLGLILVFVGLKMAWLNALFGGKFPTNVSLAIIGTLLILSIGASVLVPEDKKEA